MNPEPESDWLLPPVGSFRNEVTHLRALLARSRRYLATVPNLPTAIEAEVARHLADIDAALAGQDIVDALRAARQGADRG